MSIMNMNTEQFNEKVKEGNIILVEYMAPWCGYCRRLAPVIKKVATEYDEVLSINQVNIDENAELAEREGIEAIPTFVIYKDGKALDSIVAPDSKAKIESFINVYI